MSFAKKAEKLPLKDEDKVKLDDLIDAVYSAIDQHLGSFMNNEGSGLYAKQSTINHSCEPNAEVEFPFNNHELDVNATRNISPGEEIFFSYIDFCDLERSRHSRNQILGENYLFHCDCFKCLKQAGDPDVTSDEDMSDPDDDSD